ncbi:mpl1 [Symbiodinium sp. KB8]|nr:mpl1 [Symbiodinium sp. KB8]
MMVMLVPVMAYDARDDDWRFHDDGAPMVATITMTEILIATTKMNTIIMTTPFSPPRIVDVGDDPGVDHCGTTSLHRFSEEGEDWFFWNKARHRSWISEFESRMAAAAAAKRTLTGSSPRIRGVVNPRFFFNALLRKALSLIPHLKARSSCDQVLVVVCDPLGRLERRYADFSACATRGRVLVRGILPAQSFLTAARGWGKFLPEAPGLFFHGAANFLGASWEKLPSFRRFNAWGGHRTDLCRNRTLTRALRLALEPEYAALERFLELSGTVPSALRLRIKAILNAAQKNLYEMTAMGKGEDDLRQLEKKFEVKIIGADDIEDCNISVHFQEIADFIEAGRKKGGVVIHCAAGVSRASTSCMAYMMIKEHWSLQAAHRRVHAVRSIIHPNSGFWRQLNDLQASLVASGVTLRELPSDYAPPEQPLRPGEEATNFKFSLAYYC